MCNICCSWVRRGNTFYGHGDRAMGFLCNNFPFPLAISYDKSCFDSYGKRMQTQNSCKKGKKFYLHCEGIIKYTVPSSSSPSKPPWKLTTAAGESVSKIKTGFNTKSHLQQRPHFYYWIEFYCSNWDLWYLISKVVPHRPIVASFWGANQRSEFLNETKMIA